MIQSLGSGELDIAIGLTEGWVGGLGKRHGGEADFAGDVGASAAYRLVGTYVETPLRWAISTGAKREFMGVGDELRGKRVGVSRIGR